MSQDARSRNVYPVGESKQEEPTIEGPRRIGSLRERKSPLADPIEQLRILDDLDVRTPTYKQADFEDCLADCGHDRLGPADLEIFQINLGRLCNMSCRHCHCDAGPDKWDQVMDRETVDSCLSALDRTSAHTVDLTGGAPEMNPHFRYLVESVVSRGKHVMDRCNLTILAHPEFKDLPEWFAERGVEVVCSLPHHGSRNTDAQRGDGAHAASIEALRSLNAAGYGFGDPRRKLTLVSNPTGAFLAGNQKVVEAEWKKRLEVSQGVSFDSLITLNNMPISRFLEWLQESDNLQDYMERLVGSFNPRTITSLMCRNTISISWDGGIFDCDFNQMLEIPAEGPGAGRPTIREFDPDHFRQRRIRTARHCFGCTAGAGSSCGGALAD